VDDDIKAVAEKAFPESDDGLADLLKALRGDAKCCQGAQEHLHIYSPAKEIRKGIREKKILKCWQQPQGE